MACMPFFWVIFVADLSWYHRPFPMIALLTGGKPQWTATAHLSTSSEHLPALPLPFQGRRCTGRRAIPGR